MIVLSSKIFVSAYVVTPAGGAMEPFEPTFQ